MRKILPLERLWNEELGTYIWRNTATGEEFVDISRGKTEPAPSGDGNDPQKGAEAEFKAHEFIIEGDVKLTYPNPHLRAGPMITLTNLGSNFSGNYKVDKCKHSIGKSGYTLQLDVSRNAIGLGGFDEKSPIEQSTRPGKPGVEPENREEVRYHTVKEKDTLWDISAKYYGNGSLYTKIAEANGLPSTGIIQPGQRLIIP